MKWIGQHIYDYISRFRDDVYLEDISTGTIVSGGHLGLDSSNMIVKAADGGGSVTSVGTTGTVNGLTLTGTVTSSGNLTLGGTLAINNGDWSGTDLSVANGGTGVSTLANNSLLTGAGASAVTAEANLKFDGTDLTVATTGKVELRDGNSYIYSPTANDLEIVATDITLDAAAGISIESGGGPGQFVTINNAVYITAAAITGVTSITSTSFTAGTTVITDDSIVMTPSTNDTFTIAAAANGATTLTTVDGAATAAHFEIAADGDITLDANGDIKLEPKSGGSILLDGTIDVDAGAVTGATSITSTAFVGALTGNADTATKITSITNSNIVQLAGSQTLTGTKTLNSFKGTAGATVTNILDEDVMGSNSATALATQQSIKAYADRPAKQLKIYHANFKGNARTTETFIPLAGVPDEHTDGSKEQTAIIMPCAGMVKEIILRMHWTSTITTDDDITWRIYNRTKNLKMNAETIIGSSFTMVNPTQGSNDTNNTRTSGDLTDGEYEFAGYDAIAISMQWDSTGPTNSGDRMYVTVVTELDVSGIGY